MTAELVIGEVVELWRYPVGSVGGEAIEQLSVTGDGVIGDRVFRVVRHGSIAALAGAHVHGFASLLEVRAFFNDVGTEKYVSVTLPDGKTFRADDAMAGEMLSSYLGKSVELLPARNSMESLESKLAIPAMPVAPLHIVSTASLNELAGQLRGSVVTPERFRPNIVISTADIGGRPERSWVGRGLRIGGAMMTITENVRRCPMTSLAQPGLPRDPDIYRTILQRMGKEFGVYATPLASSTICRGDKVVLIS